MVEKIDVGELTETVIASAQRALGERKGASLFKVPPRIICGSSLSPHSRKQAARSTDSPQVPASRGECSHDMLPISETHQEDHRSPVDRPGEFV